MNVGIDNTKSAGKGKKKIQFCVDTRASIDFVYTKYIQNRLLVESPHPITFYI